MLLSQKWTRVNLFGLVMVVSLTAGLYPIYLTAAFSKNAVLALYDLSFAFGVRLALAGEAPRLRRMLWTFGASTIAAILIVFGSAMLTNLIGSKRAYEEGIGVSLVILSFYVGLPIVLLSCLMSLVSFSRSDATAG